MLQSNIPNLNFGPARVYVCVCVCFFFLLLLFLKKTMTHLVVKE